MSNEDKIVTLETYYDPILAEIVRGRLEANDIPCFIADENFGTLNPLYNQAIGGIKLKVFQHDLEKCRHLLTANDSLSVENETEGSAEQLELTKCPYCSSANVRYAQATEQRVGFFMAVASLLMLVYPFYARKSWHCFNCSRDFKAPRPIEGS